MQAKYTQRYFGKNIPMVEKKQCVHEQEATLTPEQEAINQKMIDTAEEHFKKHEYYMAPKPKGGIRKRFGLSAEPLGSTEDPSG